MSDTVFTGKGTALENDIRRTRDRYTIAEHAEESIKPISPAVDTPKTGDSTSAIAVSAVVLSSLTAALFLAVKRRKGEQE